jgi:ornithine carbamoyltransferase
MKRLFVLSGINENKMRASIFLKETICSILNTDKEIQSNFESSTKSMEGLFVAMAFPKQSSRFKVSMRRGILLHAESGILLQYWHQL